MHQDNNQYMSARNRDQIKNHSNHHDRKQRVRIQEDSPTVDDGRGKRPRVVETGPQKMETGQVPESELPSVPEDDDLNATVIDVMTDVEVLIDGTSVIDVFCCELCATKTCRS